MHLQKAHKMPLFLTCYIFEEVVSLSVTTWARWTAVCNTVLYLCCRERHPVSLMCLLSVYIPYMYDVSSKTMGRLIPHIREGFPGKPTRQ